MSKHNYLIERGLDEGEVGQAALLYEAAFGAKLGVAIKRQAHRVNLLSQGLQLDHAFAARQVEPHADQLIGMVGFTTQTGALTAGVTYQKILRELGFFRGQKAALVLSLFERKAKPQELLLDGIVVAVHHRGQGVGTELFQALIAHAKGEGFHRIRLDVLDTNSGAKALYERLGFVAERTNTFEPLRPLLGFGGSTTMVYSLA